MEIPAHVRILAAIQTGSVYFFEEDELSSREPHYFIVLNKNPRTEEFLMLACASSQTDKRKRIAKKLGFPDETIVIVSPAEYSLFTKETVIDCNRVFEKSIQTLIEKLELNKLRPCIQLMPQEIIQKLVKGVLASNQVSEKVRKMLL